MLWGKKGAVWTLLILLIIAVILVFAVAYYSGDASRNFIDLKTLGGDFKDGTACINESCFKLIVADDPQERARGLMNREGMNNDEGMLFIFENDGEQSMWMKNTLMPLDMLWISGEGRIVHIEANNQPCPATAEFCPPITNANSTAKYVLEIRGGMINLLGIKKGDQARIKLAS